MTATTIPTRSADGLPSPPRGTQTRTENDPAPRITTSFPSRAERDRVFTWLDAGLRPDRPGRLAQEYPHLFESGSAAVPITVWLGNRPASFCFLWPVSFALAGGTLRTALISLVYTDPRDRGRGLARAALARALDEARAQERGLCVLWSELADFYTAQRFHRAGRETLLVVDDGVFARARAAGAEPQSDALRIEPARVEDWPAIAAIRARRACHAPLPTEATAIASIPDLDVRVARGRAGVVAFAMAGRGDDFPGVIHEWGGETDGMLGCCRALLEGAGPDGGLLVLSPDERSDFTFRLRSAGARVVRNPLAFFTIASVPALAADLSKLVPGLATTLRVDSTALSAPELLSLLFSEATDPLSANARAKLGHHLTDSERASLPLPFFVWGLESI